MILRSDWDFLRLEKAYAKVRAVVAWRRRWERLRSFHAINKLFLGSPSPS
jgi:hypothetical protein